MIAVLSGLCFASAWKIGDLGNVEAIREKRQEAGMNVGLALRAMVNLTDEEYLTRRGSRVVASILKGTDPRPDEGL